VIDPETRAQIRRYFYAEHWKIGTIARELNVHPDAVRNAIEPQRLGLGGLLQSMRAHRDSGLLYASRRKLNAHLARLPGSRSSF
jgi:hypothetical protein